MNDSERPRPQRGERETQEHQLLKQYDGLIKQKASYYWRKIRDFGTVIQKEDLIQEASIALLKAHQEYNPEKGANFLTFAWNLIDYALKDYLNQHARTVKITDYGLDKLKQDNRIDDPSNTAGNHDQGHTGEATFGARQWRSGVTTTRVGGETTDIFETLSISEESGNLRLSDVRRLLEKKELFEKIMQRAQLDEQELFIINNRLGLNESGGMLTLQEIGERVKLTHERVRQIEVKILKKLERARKQIEHEDKIALLNP